MAWQQVFAGLMAGAGPILPQLCLIALAGFALVCPVPGRGPRLLQKLDPWRLFKGTARRSVMARAGGRCEGSVFLIWGRCPDAATEVDHVYPWSRRGPTTPENGQALCRSHNRQKGAMRPPWWYVLALEHRRRKYFPPDIDVRVTGRISASELAHHTIAPRPQVRP